MAGRLRALGAGAAVALALLLLVQVPISAEPHPAAIPRPVAHPFASVTSIVQGSTATATGKANRNFWQNGSGQYATGSSQLLIPSNLAGYAPTSIITSTLTLTVGMPNGMTPMVNVTQGATSYLINATLPYSASVGTKVSTTPVKVAVVAAFTSTGTTPSVAKYPVFYNWSIQVVYSNVSTPKWILQNGSVENLSVPLTVPTGYNLTQTSITLPYPFQALPNVTTLNVTTAAGYKFAGPFTNLTTYTTQPSLGYLAAYLPTIGANETLRIKYLVLGLQTGKIPLLILGGLTLLSSGLYEATASYVNTGALPYAGFYYIQLNKSVKYAVVPGSLNVTANTHYLKNSTFSLAGSQVIVLPGAWTTYGGRPTVFTLKFQLAGVPPSLTLCLSCKVGTTSVSWWEVAAASEVLFASISIGLFSQKRTRLIIENLYEARQDAESTAFWVSTASFAVVLLVVAVAFVTGGT